MERRPSIQSSPAKVTMKERPETERPYEKCLRAGAESLTGYTMAVDRGNAEVAYLYSAYNPAVLRSIERVIKVGRAEGIMVGMCGEAAADPLLAPLLISFGLSEFSVSATSILATRKGISLWTKEEADAVAAKAMSMTTEAEVEAYLKTVAKH